MKKRNDKFVEKCFWIGTRLMVVGLLFLFVLACYSLYQYKKELKEKYNLGVHYYEIGRYVEAMDVFSSFHNNWRQGDLICTDEYYEMAREAAMKDVKYEAIEVIRYATEEEQRLHSKEQLQMLAKTVYGEARGCSKTEQAAVIWCILNRVDSKDFPNDIMEVIIQKNQFEGYSENNPINYEMIDLVSDVMDRWILEKTAVGTVGRVLPKEYIYFVGDGTKNYFNDGNGNVWNWTLDSPYNDN